MLKQLEELYFYRIVISCFIIMIFFIWEGCNPFPSTQIDEESICVVDNELRILFSKRKYIVLDYENNQFGLGAKLVEYKFDISEIGNNKIKLMEKNEILKEKSGETWNPNYVNNSNGLIVSSYKDLKKEKNQYGDSIYSVKNKQIVKILYSDDPYFGEESYNFSKIYFYQSGEVHLFDVNTMTEEVLPHIAYEFMKEKLVKEKFSRPTDIKYIFIYKNNKNEFALFNITNGDVMCKFAIPNAETLLNVVFKNEQWLFLSEKINIYECSGKIINQLELERSSSSYRRFVDSNKDQIYFVRFENESPSESQVYGYLDIIRWNYITNEVLKVTHELTWDDF